MHTEEVAGVAPLPLVTNCLEGGEAVEKLPCTQCWPSNEPQVGRYRGVENPVRGLDRSVTVFFNRLGGLLVNSVPESGLSLLWKAASRCVADFNHHLGMFSRDLLACWRFPRVPCSRRGVRDLVAVVASTGTQAPTHRFWGFR